MTQKLETLLTQLARDPAAPLDIAEVSLLLARDEFPFLDVEGHLSELMAMAKEVKPALRGHLSHQVQGLCRYLFHDLGFHGNESDYYDPNNSYFNQVLERRTGIPITLAAVTMAIGQRAGMKIEGVGIPGHFIVKAVNADQEIIIDPFHGGRVLSPQDCEILVQQATGWTFEASSLALQGQPLGRTVLRMLNNLRSIYFKKEDWARAIRVMERLRSLTPEDVILQRDLGTSFLKLGQPGKAIDPLRRYLEKAEDADDAEAIRDMLQSARATIARWN